MEKENKATIHEENLDLKTCISIFDQAMEKAFSYDLIYEEAYKKACKEACLSDEVLGELLSKGFDSMFLLGALIKDAYVEAEQMEIITYFYFVYAQFHRFENSSLGRDSAKNKGKLYMNLEKFIEASSPFQVGNN